MSIVNGFLTLKMKTVHFRLSDLASLEHGLERLDALRASGRTLDKNPYKSPGSEVRKRKDTTEICSGMWGIDSEDGTTDDLGSVSGWLRKYELTRTRDRTWRIAHNF